MHPYSKAADRGETELLGDAQVAKDDARIASIGDLDELNATLGAARSARLPAELDALARALQEQLFTVGAVLASPDDRPPAGALDRLSAEWAPALEAQIKALEAQLPPLQHFILPGGSPAAAALHVARTTCRRAERRVVSSLREGHPHAAVVAYLNRLSDLLFVMARQSNRLAGVREEPWAAPGS